MRLRTVSSIILPSAHKVKASARNSVTTVVGGGEMLRGTLERVPRTPQNFSQILYRQGWGGGAERGLAPGGGRAPARHWLGGALAVPGGGLAFFVACLPCRRRTRRGLNPCGTGSLCPGGEDHLKRRRRLRRIVPSPPVPPLLGCRHCSKESISCHSGGKPWTSLCAGHLLGRLCKCRRRSNAGDARGGAPCMKITLIPPSPPGKGAGGIGGKKKTKGRGGGRQRRQAPRLAPA